jgi:hypothetical protein
MLTENIMEYRIKQYREPLVNQPMWRGRVKAWVGKQVIQMPGKGGEEACGHSYCKNNLKKNMRNQAFLH